MWCSSLKTGPGCSAPLCREIGQEPERVKETEVVAKLLAKAAHKLHLTNTTDWVAFVGERQINPELTFKENVLSGTVEIEWHKPEGGGGTPRPEQGTHHQAHGTTHGHVLDPEQAQSPADWLQHVEQDHYGDGERRLPDGERERPGRVCGHRDGDRQRRP